MEGTTKPHVNPAHTMVDPQNHIALFKGKTIRKTIFNNEWYFSVVDVCEALTDSADAKDYWYRMKKRVSDDEKIELSTICRQLKLEKEFSANQRY